MQKNTFELFMERTDERLAHISHKVDSLWTFRAMLIGGSIAVSVFCSTLISILAVYFELHK